MLSEERRQELISKLGTVVDRSLAKEFGVTLSLVYHLRQKLKIEPKRSNNITPEIIALLGKVTDTEISEKFDMAQSNISRIRTKLRIPVCPYAKGGALKKTVYPPDIMRMFGTAPVREIAKKLRISHQRVYQIELERGIVRKKLNREREEL